jgi:photosystem II stability/assembly factor-like uncharacterized protein
MLKRTIVAALLVCVACGETPQPEPQPAPDTQAPTLGALQVSPTRARAGQTITVTFTADEPVTAWVRVAGRTADCPANAGMAIECQFNTSGQESEGAVPVEVLARDAAGNEAQATSTVTLDFTAPSTTLGDVADDGQPSRQLTFTADEEGAVFECSRGASPFAPCTSPWELVDLHDAVHHLQVRAVDLVGNVEPSPPWIEVTVDTTPPAVVFEAVPLEVTSRAYTRFAFSASEEGCTFACRLDLADFQPCTSPTEFTVTEGEHTFEVRPTDRYGNTGEAALFAWELDLTPPLTTIVQAPPALGNQTEVQIHFTASEPASFECSLNGSGTTPCQSPWVLTGLAEGFYQARVRATDRAYNVELVPAEVGFELDLTAPSVSFTTTPLPVSTSTSATFAFEASEPEATLECALDAAPFAACTSPVGLEVSEGSHTFRVRATDPAGNVGTTVDFTFEVDLTAPVPPMVVQPDPSAFANSTPTLAWAAIPDAVSYTFELSVSETFATVDRTVPGLTQPWWVAQPALRAGRYFFRVSATDAAGNGSGWSAPGQFEVEAWRFLAPTPTGTVIQSVTCVDAQRCWFSGTGALMRTEDGGATFIRSAAVPVGISNIVRVDAQTLIAGGATRTLLRSTDNGRSFWSVQQPAGLTATQPFNRVAFAANAPVGYAVATSGTIIKSTDGGASWIKLTPPASTQSLLDIHIIDLVGDQVAVVGNGGTFWRTGDGGATWSVESLGTADQLQSVHFVNPQLGFVGAAGRVYRTADGGQSWLAVPTASHPWLFNPSARNIAFWDTARGVLVTGGSEPQFTADGGLTWTNAAAPDWRVMSNLFLLPGGLGYAVGNSGAVMKTNDYGASWTPASGSEGQPPFLASWDFRAISTVGASTAFFFGTSGIAARTNDGGQTFQTLVVDPVDTSEVYASSFVDASEGWVAGQLTSWATGLPTGRALLARTGNGGQSFTTLDASALPAGLTSVNGVHFLSSAVGVAVGNASAVMRWNPVTSTFDPDLVTDASGAALPGTRVFNAVSLPDAQTGFVVGNGGDILRYDAVAGRWEREVSGTTQNLLGVAALDAQTAIAVGTNTLLRRSSTGWANIPLPANPYGTGTVSLQKVAFVDANIGYAVGTQGAIYRTDDGGLTWTGQWVTARTSIYAVAPVGAQQAFLGGAGRSILWTEVGGF